MSAMTTTTTTAVKNRTPKKSSLAPFKRLAWIADDLVERSNEIGRMRSTVRNAYEISQLPREDQIKLLECDLAEIADAKALINRLEYDAYETIEDEDDDEYGPKLKRDVIAKRLSVLVGSFPSSQAAAPENFSRMLVEHVAAANVTCLALHTGCMHLESTRASMPPIAAVLTALSEHEEKWSCRRRAIYNLAFRAQLALREFHERRAELEAAQRRNALVAATSTFADARRDLIQKQTAAAKITAEIAEGFRRLRDAQDALHDAQSVIDEVDGPNYAGIST